MIYTLAGSLYVAATGFSRYTTRQVGYSETDGYFFVSPTPKNKNAYMVSGNPTFFQQESSIVHAWALSYI